MLKTGHRTTALTLTNTANLILQPSLPLFIITNVITYMAATLPDLDRHNLIFKHRGFTHSLFALLILSIGFNFILNYLNLNPITHWLCLFSFTASYLLHLIIDSLSIANIRWLAPFSNHQKDNKYGIYLGQIHGQTIHHHFNYIGYRVGGHLEKITTLITSSTTILLITRYLFLYLSHPNF